MLEQKDIEEAKKGVIKAKEFRQLVEEYILSKNN